MLIHSFFSDGLYPWAELFLDSFKKYHGDVEHKIAFKTIGLSKNQIIKLHDRYDNLNIDNINYDMEHYANLLNTTIKELKWMKEEIEHGDDKRINSYKWKILMSVEERYRKSIPEAIRKYRNEKYMLHSDIDMYFNKNIEPILETVKSHDICAETRTWGVKSLEDSTKIAGGLIGINMTSDLAEQFIGVWCGFIDSIPTHKKPREFGQTSLYYAYDSMKNKQGFKWGKFTSEREFSMFKKKNAFIWSGNRGVADKNLNDFCYDFYGNSYIPVHTNITNHPYGKENKKIKIKRQKRLVLLDNDGLPIKKERKTKKRKYKPISTPTVEEKTIKMLKERSKLIQQQNFKDMSIDKEDFMVHSFFSDGLIEWAKLFLNSFKLYHGEDIKIVFSTRNVTNDQITDLKRIYENLDIYNENIPMNTIASEIGISKKEVSIFKKQIENGEVTKNNFRWKLFMSVKERYGRSIIETISMYRDTYKYMLHSDIDMYFRNRIDNLFKLLTLNDICLRFRLNDKNEKGRICGNIIGFDLTKDAVEYFMFKWMEIINGLKIEQMPKGFGQISLYQTYLMFYDDDHVNFGNIDDNSILSVSRNIESIDKGSSIWEANTGSKIDNLLYFREDFKQRKKQRGRK